MFRARTAKIGSIRSSSAFTLIELLVVISIIGILVGMLLPAVQQVRDATRLTSCSVNLQQLRIALINHESANGRFPVGTEYGTSFSWASRVLPQLEQTSLRDQIEFSAAWDSPINESAVSKTLPAFSCPTSPKSFDGLTDYCGIAGSWMEVRKDHNGSRNGMLFPAPLKPGV